VCPAPRGRRRSCEGGHGRVHVSLDIPQLAGQWLLTEEAAEPGERVALIRPGWRYAFMFSGPAGQPGEGRMTALLTDHAGLRWEIDQDLHLARA